MMTGNRQFKPNKEYLQEQRYILNPPQIQEYSKYKLNIPKNTRIQLSQLLIQLHYKQIILVTRIYDYMIFQGCPFNQKDDAICFFKEDPLNQMGHFKLQIWSIQKVKWYRFGQQNDTDIKNINQISVTLYYVEVLSKSSLLQFLY
ncbi:unnamed protein product [Paramecium octaurelia]|uniref:Uncharacterized protein n=1 Tax=Paramecium octaurelia TaxID=43137 RepID=A0A8S1W2F0_PAROT|nr:unnamed protein product [Paramecium octaurelia]